MERTIVSSFMPSATEVPQETRTGPQEAADAARKSTAHVLYWTFLALLVGAFCASVAAIIGGKQRDRVP